MSYSIPGYREEPRSALSSDLSLFAQGLGDLAAIQEESIAAAREFGRVVLAYMKRLGRKPAGGRLLRSKRLRKKAGLG